jgi:hypothetical protein
MRHCPEHGMVTFTMVNGHAEDLCGHRDTVVSVSESGKVQVFLGRDAVTQVKMSP